MTPLVSCLIPAYNAAAFVCDAIDSVAAQTHSRVEIIVVDDGSTDATAQVVRDHPADVRLLTCAHRGLAATRDEAVRAATGDFLAFLDADDTWLAHKLERQLTALEGVDEIDLCTSHFLNVWDNPADAQRYAGTTMAAPMGGYCPSSVIGRRAAFDFAGAFERPDRQSDTGWFASAVARGATVHILDDVLVMRRIHPTNDSVVNARLDGLFDLIKARRTRGIPAE